MMDEKTQAAYVRWLDARLHNSRLHSTRTILYPPDLRWTIEELVYLTNLYTCIPDREGWKVVERTPEYDVSFYMPDRKSG